jgi:hypothetical protein
VLAPGLLVDAVHAQDRDAAVMSVFADTEWYRARPEPEQTWRGQLAERNVASGPGGRPALAFELKTSKGAIPIYEDGLKSRIASLVGSSVEVRGKLVDLTREGFGVELWIGSARKLPTQ